MGEPDFADQIGNDGTSRRSPLSSAFRSAYLSRLRPPRPGASWPARHRAYLIGLPLILLPTGWILASSFSGGVEGQLPVATVDLGASFVRMILAYGLSLGFSLGYGYYAATNRTADRILIPVLDILQSVPILGFFPLVVAIFVNATPGSPIGANMATIFLIFTAMSWNMAFGVYESLKSVPSDLREAADSYGVHGIQRLRRVLLPATINRLVYNTVLSWTAGWYYLVGAEIITSARGSTVLPGIGSYLAVAAAHNDPAALVTGISLLVALVTALDLFAWRPLGHWAERYRYEQAPSGATEAEARTGGRVRRAVGSVARGFASGVTRLRGPLVSIVSRVPGVQLLPRRTTPRSRIAIRYLALGTALVLVWLLLITLVVVVFRVLTGPISAMEYHQMLGVPQAMLFSSGRVALAYGLSVAIALPLAIYLVRRPRAYRVGLPLVEIIASVPATALFPLFILALDPYIGLNGVAVLLLLTGMIWYLFFNVVSGLRSIPSDLIEAARSYGLTRWQYYRRLILPAIFPAFITGSITAFGGGWNALVFAEYFQVNNVPLLQVPGIGQLISVATYRHENPLLVVSLFTLVLVVIALNEVLWKPMYRRAVNKYRFD
ncbi:MAG: ABC transporter permease subunit [Thermoplasmata archaeon]